EIPDAGLEGGGANSPNSSILSERARIASSWCVLRIPHVSIALLAATQLACVGIGGETIRIRHDSLWDSASPRSAGFVSLVEPAQDARADQTRIGRATFTLFAITSGSIKTYEPVGYEVVRNVEAALKSVGYEVLVDDRAALLSDRRDSDPSPAIIVTVDEFYFRNYNWLWPYVPTWGDIQLTIEVQTPDAERVYRRTFRGHGKSYQLSGHSAFFTATKNAMTEVIQQLLDEVSSEAFQAAAVRLQEEEAARTRVAEEAAPRASATDRLLELEELREDELITEEQYERMRQEILEDL
ncbi:MAG: hypothetical protein QNK03_23010, partial [Myxococcota bacterium]|nr:hypothetical protein [Myxococcota bacterium]